MEDNKNPVVEKIRKSVLDFASYIPVVWAKFSRDSCFSMAAALSFSTIISLVPIATLSFSLISNFKFFSGMEDKVRDFFFNILIPEQADVMQNYILAFSRRLSSLNTISFISFLLTGIFLLVTLENNLNHIWKVKNRKGFVRGIFVYWAVLTLGPLMIGVSFYLTGIANVETIFHNSFLAPVFSFISSYLVNTIFLFIIYFWMTNARVRFKPAATAALISGLVYEILKNSFSAYIHRMAYTKIYGSLAVLPIFLIWIYMVWVVIMIGAEINYFIQHPDAANRDEEEEPGFILPVEILIVIVRSFYINQLLDTAKIFYEFPHFSIQRINRALKILEEEKLVLFHEERGWIPYQEPEGLKFSESLSRIMGIGMHDDKTVEEMLVRIRLAVGKEFPESVRDIALKR